MNLFVNLFFPTGTFDELTVLNLGKLIDILGMLLISLGFYSVEFAELKWKQAIKHLMVINKGGICLFYYPFVEGEDKGKGDEPFDRQLAAGAIMGVQSILGEVIDKQKSEQLESVDYKGKKLMFKTSPDKLVNVVLISDQDLIILHEKLERLAKDIEEYFRSYLEKNITKIDLYKPISYFIEELFRIEKPKREIVLNT